MTTLSRAAAIAVDRSNASVVATPVSNAQRHHDSRAPHYALPPCSGSAWQCRASWYSQPMWWVSMDA